MAICIEGDANRSVAQPLLNHFRIDASFQQQRSRQMPQGMEGHPLDAELIQRFMEVAQQITGGNGLVGREVNMSPCFCFRESMCRLSGSMA